MNIAGSARQVAEVSPVAIYGAVLSTILMFVKFWELWRSRGRIEVDFQWTPDAEIGNTLVIRNLSGTPITITYLKLEWRRCRWCKANAKQTIEPEEFEDVVIAGNSSEKLVFAGIDHFTIAPRSLGKNSIYVWLTIAGKSRAVIKKVYPH